MIRVAAALTCILLLTSRPAAAMVGGAQPTNEGAGRAVVMLTGSRVVVSIDCHQNGISTP